MRNKIIYLLFFLLIVSTVHAEQNVYVIKHISSNGTTIVNGTGNTSWNQSLADTLYYPLGSNPLGYYNSTTLPASGGGGGWTNASGLVYLVNSTDKVGIGDSTPDAQLDVQSTGINNIGLIVQGIASQNASLSQWLTSTGTIVDEVYSDGRVKLGGSAGFTMTAASDSGLNVLVGSSGNYGSTRAIYAEINDVQSSGTPIANALSLTAYHGATGTASGGAVGGLYAISRQISTRPMNSLMGMSMYSPYVTANGTVTDGIGVNLQSYLAANAVVTNYKGLLVNTPSVDAGGNLSNDYGIYIANQDKGALSNYAIYSAGGAVYFMAGGATVVPLTLRSASGQTAHIQDWRDAGGSVITYITNTGDILTAKSSYTANRYGITSTLYGSNTSATGSAAIQMSATANHQTGTLGALYSGYFIATQSGYATMDNLYGLYGIAKTASNGTTNSLLAYRAFTYTDGANRGTVGNMKGMEIVASNTDASNRIGTYYGIDIAPTTNGGNITTAYGLRINDWVNTGLITTQYGIYLGNIETANTTNYAIYTNNGTVRLGDTLNLAKNITMTAPNGSIYNCGVNNTGGFVCN